MEKNYERLKESLPISEMGDVGRFNSWLFTYSRNMASEIQGEIAILAKSGKVGELEKKKKVLEYYDKISQLCENYSIENAYQAAIEK